MTPTCRPIVALEITSPDKDDKAFLVPSTKDRLYHYHNEGTPESPYELLYETEVESRFGSDILLQAKACRRLTP